MPLNYVIATYAGRDTQYVLECHLQHLLAIMMGGKLTELKQVTVMCPPVKAKDKHNYKGKYYDISRWQAIFERAGAGVALVFEEYVGSNEYASYDQWIQAYLRYPNFDYYLLIEDDYVPYASQLTFDADLVALYKESLIKNDTQIGYLCTYACNDHGMFHASISNGLVSRQTFETMGQSILEKFYDIPHYSQLAFSELFTRHNIPIFDWADKYVAIFWSSLRGQISVYSPIETTEYMLLPIQYLTWKDLK